MIQDVLYTPEEIADRLKITKFTVYEMIKRGELSAHRLGRHLRISDAQFQLYLMKARGYDNLFAAELIREDGDSLALVEDVRIWVSTPLTGPGRIAISPDDVILSLDPLKSSARNVLPGIVRSIEQEDGEVRILLDVGFPLTAHITPRSLRELGFAVGDSLYAVFKALSVRVFR
ncbi:TOBE domain protein [anaerobic digester metagenome]